MQFLALAWATDAPRQQHLAQNGAHGNVTGAGLGLGHLGQAAVALLNAPDTEGDLVGGYTQFQPNGTPIESSYVYRPSDGNDRIFGDMGNDWIVGGTGRDHIYGGFGNDLLNADDVMGVPDGDGTASYDLTGALNDAPETHRVWEDRVFGGAGTLASMAPHMMSHSTKTSLLSKR